MKINGDIIKTGISIFAAAVAAGSCYFTYQNFEVTKKDRQPDIKIIQNLWTKNPSFELVNESKAKLDSTPSPTYGMLIPSKLYYLDQKNKVTFSSLILSLVSYQVIEEQIVGNQTTDSIITSTLPKNFYAKKGDRDIITGKQYKMSDDLSLMVSTLPFLVIVSPIQYKYDNREEEMILLSTPLENIEISKKDFKNVTDYMKDTGPDLEVKIDGDKSVYETAHKNVEKQLMPLLENNNEEAGKINMKILGGSDDGKGYGHILKDINGMIKYLDPMEQD